MLYLFLRGYFHFVVALVICLFACAIVIFFYLFIFKVRK